MNEPSFSKIIEQAYASLSEVIQGVEELEALIKTPGNDNKKGGEE